MTTPTDAQIEAAAKAICNDKHYPDQEAWDHMPHDIRDIYRKTAKAALTAAAEVKDAQRETVTDEMIKAGSEAIDKYYDGTKDAPFEGSVEACYRAMRLTAAAGNGNRRVLKETDAFCPSCGHNRDKSAVSSIDHGSFKSCQKCGAEWTEIAAAEVGTRDLTPQEQQLMHGALRASSVPAAAEVGDKCANCGYPKSEHHHDGACYGLCGEFVTEATKLRRDLHTIAMRQMDERAAEVGQQELCGFTQFDLDKDRKRIADDTIERCAQELEAAYAECATLNLLHGAARLRALKGTAPAEGYLVRGVVHGVVKVESLEHDTQEHKNNEP